MIVLTPRTSPPPPHPTTPYTHPPQAPPPHPTPHSTSLLCRAQVSRHPLPPCLEIKTLFLSCACQCRELKYESGPATDRPRRAAARAASASRRSSGGPASVCVCWGGEPGEVAGRLLGTTLPACSHALTLTGAAWCS